MISYLLRKAIRSYQYILSPWVGQQCRFTPSCSHYAYEAINLHGSWYGSWLTVKRIARCHPLCEGGFDPVPPRSHQHTDIEEN